MEVWVGTVYIEPKHKAQRVSSWLSFDEVFQRVVSWGSECLSSCGIDSKGDEAIEEVCREMEKQDKMVPSKH